MLIGRPYLWALAVGGQAGVEHLFELLRDELDLDMALAGRPTIASIDRTLVIARGMIVSRAASEHLPSPLTLLHCAPRPIRLESSTDRLPSFDPPTIHLPKGVRR